MTIRVGIGGRIADGTPNSPTPLFPCPLPPLGLAVSSFHLNQFQIVKAVDARGGATFGIGEIE